MNECKILDIINSILPQNLAGSQNKSIFPPEISKKLSKIFNAQ